MFHVIVHINFCHLACCLHKPFYCNMYAHLNVMCCSITIPHMYYYYFYFCFALCNCTYSDIFQYFYGSCRCFCHKKTIDMGYVCSVCLSIFCKHHKKCSTCGLVLIYTNKFHSYRNSKCKPFTYDFCFFYKPH